MIDNNRNKCKHEIMKREKFCETLYRTTRNERNKTNFLKNEIDFKLIFNSTKAFTQNFKKKMR